MIEKEKHFESFIDKDFKEYKDKAPIQKYIMKETEDVDVTKITEKIGSKENSNEQECTKTEI